MWISRQFRRLSRVLASKSDFLSLLRNSRVLARLHFWHATTNGVGKEHRKVEEQRAMIAQRQKQIAAQQATAAQQQKQIEALTATVRKVSDQIALSKPSPQFAATH